MRPVRAGALVALAALVLSACGGDDAASPEPKRTPPPETQVVETDGDLAVGITEPNPNFIWPKGARDVPEPFARWRDELHEMRPRYYRLVVDWAGVSSPDGRQIDLDKPNGGCMRDVQPCAGYSGVRDQLRALGAAQKAADGEAWDVLVVIGGTPEGLASEPRGCERAGTQPRSRPPADTGISVYGKLITRIVDEARAADVRLRYWSPWNEPNHPFFISPQRERCSAKARSAAIAPYVALAEEMRRTLEAEDVDHELVLGELAGLLERKSGYTDVVQFIEALPRELVCASSVWSQHGYVGGPDPVDEAADALAVHRCERTHAIWMTETGAGRPRRGERRETSAAAHRRQCRGIRGRLVRWYEDPRVSAAFQYTLREDDRFPTGLVTTSLSEAYPALREWQAWGRRAPRDPPPPSTCGA